ncbi:MAG: phage portal protein [Kineosporiaceae bacterium]|nr:phage portal protein [Aeromicrobium sp.]
MASLTKPGPILQMVADGMIAFRRQREETLRVDVWTKGAQLDHNDPAPHSTTKEGWPFIPSSNNSREFDDLASRAPAPWGKLIVSSLAQTIYMESARIKGSPEDATMESFGILQENNWAARQIPLTRATIGHGVAYVKALPAVSPIDGADSALVRPVSALRMAAFYDDLDDEWPSYAIEVDDYQIDIDNKKMTFVRFYDETAVHALWFEGTGESVSDYVYAGVIMEHQLGICPIVRFANLMDLEGRSMGEIAPILPLLRRIDQDTFDRLVVQRFGAWKIRYIAGIAEPDTDEAKRAQAMVLRMQDLLIAGDPDTKFGTLDETAVSGFIEATDADLRVLAAVTQTPPHHLLGLSSNLQAEALAAAEAGLQRKSLDFQIYNSGSYQQLLRLIAMIRKNTEEASSKQIDIRYRDTESRSLVQAAQALGTLATQLKMPVEMLWGRVPGWSDEDSERAKRLIEEGGVDQLLDAMTQALGVDPTQGDAAQSPAQGSDQSGQSTV